MNDSSLPEISPEDFMVIKKELRGEEVSELLDMKEITVMPEMTEMPEMTGSFLDMENI